MSDPIVEALAAGATVVTPNNRLARHFELRHDAAQVAAGRATWPTPRALPWHLWLRALWADALDAGAFASPFVLLNAAQSRRLWERAIEADGTELLDAGAAAQRAERAWQAFSAHARPAESPSQWTGGDDDAAAFARWQRRFARACDDAGARDLAAAAHALVAAAPRVAQWRARHVILAGFTELTPGARRLCDTLAASGARIDVDALTTRDAPPSAAPVRREYPSATDELVAALTWARERALAAAGAAVQRWPAAVATIAVRDLESRRSRIVELADEVLRPDALARAGLGEVAPYNVSLAPALAAHPLAVCAADLLALAVGRLALPRAAALLRSPFLAGGAHAALRRGDCERRWRDANVAELAMPAVIDALAADDPLREGLVRVAVAARDRAARAPDRWAEAFRASLAAAGWPGDDALSSAQHQAVEAVWRVLGEWRALSLVESRMSARNAVSSFVAALAEASFQPEAHATAIDIVGVLEAAGQRFEGLWLAGMDASGWPMRAAPLPLLPASWQHARGLVEASPARTLDRAQRLTAQLVAGAKCVVASHVVGPDRPPLAASPLTHAWPLAPAAPMPRPLARVMAAGAALERFDDARLPALARGRAVRGGARVIELQSDCPFRAAAALRFDAGAWAEPTPGLTPMERGIVLHAALAAFWQRVGDRATLDALGDTGLAAAAEAAANDARGALAEARWRALPPVAVAAEFARLARTLATFAAAHERGRPDFRVVASERPLRFEVGGLALSLRADRIDAIDEGLALIDYKSGDAIAPAQWITPRPRAPQLGLYALALAAEGEGPPVRAVALASLRAGDACYAGLAEPDARWTGLKEVADVDPNLADFAALEARWAAVYTALADAYREGDAAVDPRLAARPCPHCDFKPFCRIDDSAVAGGAGGDDGDDAPGSEEGRARDRDAPRAP